MSKKSNDRPASARIADNKKARFDYSIEETFEAGLAARRPDHATQHGIDPHPAGPHPHAQIAVAPQ
jgi:hypothetical protein